MKKPITNSGHTHTWHCTESSCPGNGFVTREDLIRRTLARRQSATPEKKPN